MIRLRHLVEIGPRPVLGRGIAADAEVTFAPMDALADGLGGLDTLLTRPLSEVAAGSYNYFADGDLLLAKVTPCFENGKKALARGLVNGIGFATSEVHVIRPEARRIHPQYLLYLLSSEDFRAAGMASMTGAGGLRRVSETAVLDYRPRITDLPTQMAIANFLDRETARIDQLIEKKQRLAELLGEKRAALIERAIVQDGPETQLGHHVDILSGYAFPSAEFSNDPEDVPLLRGVNVSPGRVRWEEVVYWPRIRVTEVSRFILRAGDVVLGMDRPWIVSGIRVAELCEADAPSLLLQRVCRIAPRRTLYKGFMKLLLSSRRFLGHFEPILTGVSVPHISPDQIRAFRFNHMNVDRQRSLAHGVECTDAKIKKVVEVVGVSLDRLREFRAALITAAVTGQIDVATWRKRGNSDCHLDAIEQEMAS